MDHAVLPVFPTPTELMAEVTPLRSMKNISPNHSLPSKEKIFAAGTWMPCILPSQEKLLRLMPWKRRVWPTWLNALDWRTSSEHSMSVRVNEYLTPDDVSSFHNRLRYIEPQFRIWQLQPA